MQKAGEASCKEGDGEKFKWYMGRRTGPNIVRQNMHKVNRHHADSEIASSMLRNKEQTARDFYFEKKPETGCQETLDAIRWAHDKLGLQEEEQDFNLQLELQRKAEQKAFPWKTKPKQIQPQQPTQADASLSQLFRTQPEVGKPDLHQIQRVQNSASDVAQNVPIPAMNKESLLFLAMKSKHEQEKNNHEFMNMSLLNAIQSL